MQSFDENKVTILIWGLGVIGGSLAMALKKNGFGGRVLGYDLNAEAQGSAEAIGAIESSEASLEEMVAAADLVIVAVPLQCYDEVFSMLGRLTKETALITDVGSVKVWPHSLAEKHLSHRRFVGGHPMAGSENSGFGAARAHLFENAYYFLTGTQDQEEASATLEQFVAFIGAKGVRLDAAEHDAIVARTSHLPHLMATLLVHQLEGSADYYVGGGFRDTTRIASGNPVLWRHILRYNEKEILTAIDEHRCLLDQVERLLTEGSPDGLGRFLQRASELREAIPKGAKDTLMGDRAIHVDLVDTPGGIAQVTGRLADAGINIADIEILHVREGVPGVLKIGFYDDEAYRAARQLFDEKEESQ